MVLGFPEKMYSPSKLSSFAGLSLPSIFTSSSKIPNFSIPTKPVSLHLLTKFSSLKTKSRFPSSLTFVSQISDSAQQEEESEQEQGQLESDDARLFVGNLNRDVDSQTLAMLFLEAGTVEIVEIICNRGNTQQSRGYGFVTMSSVAEAEKAIEMFDQFELNGKLLTVSKSVPRKPKPERAPRESELAFKVFVANLPWSVDKSRLEQLFSKHGKVVAANIVYNQEARRSRGYGFVAMSNETEVNNAVAALNGLTLDGRVITVDVARKPTS